MPIISAHRLGGQQAGGRGQALCSARSRRARTSNAAGEGLANIDGWSEAILDGSIIRRVPSSRSVTEMREDAFDADRKSVV